MSPATNLVMDLTMEQGRGRVTQVQPPLGVWEQFFGVRVQAAARPTLRLVNMDGRTPPEQRKVVKHHHNFTLEMSGATLPRPAIVRMRRLDSKSFEYWVYDLARKPIHIASGYSRPLPPTRLRTGAGLCFEKASPMATPLASSTYYDILARHLVPMFPGASLETAPVSIAVSAQVLSENKHSMLVKPDLNWPQSFRLTRSTGFEVDDIRLVRQFVSAFREKLVAADQPFFNTWLIDALKMS